MIRPLGTCRPVPRAGCSAALCDVPAALSGRISLRAYRAWLERTARSQTYRDQKRGRDNVMAQAYLEEFHAAVCRHNGCDAYTGEQLDGERIGTLDWKRATADADYLVQFEMLPTIDHATDPDAPHRFEICGLGFNRAKGVLPAREYLMRVHQLARICEVAADAPRAVANAFDNDRFHEPREPLEAHGRLPVGNDPRAHDASPPATTSQHPSVRSDTQPTRAQFRAWLDRPSRHEPAPPKRPPGRRELARLANTNGVSRDRLARVVQSTLVVPSVGRVGRKGLRAVTSGKTLPGRAMSNSPADSADSPTTPGAQPPEEFTGLRTGSPGEVAGGPKAVGVATSHVWGAAGPLRGTLALLRMNQHNGFDCPGCAWPDPADPSFAEFCENGAKALAEEATTRRVGPTFFARHTVAALQKWSDLKLGKAGRLTHPMVRREGAEHYEPISWDQAFGLIAAELNALDSPDEAVFYTSGRTSNEAAFLWQLFVRQYGTNNLPDCSNLCHESSGTGLKETIGVGKGTVSLDCFYDHADTIVVIGQNPGTNHPRMLTALQAAARPGAVQASAGDCRLGRSRHATGAVVCAGADQRRRGAADRCGQAADRTARRRRECARHGVH